MAFLVRSKTGNWSENKIVILEVGIDSAVSVCSAVHVRQISDSRADAVNLVANSQLNTPVADLLEVDFLLNTSNTPIPSST